MRAAVRKESSKRQRLAAETLPAGRYRTDPVGFHLWMSLTAAVDPLGFCGKGIGVVVSDAFATESPVPEAVRGCLGAPRIGGRCTRRWSSWLTLSSNRRPAPRPSRSIRKDLIAARTCSAPGKAPCVDVVRDVSPLGKALCVRWHICAVPIRPIMDLSWRLWARRRRASSILDAALANGLPALEAADMTPGALTLIRIAG